MEGLRNAYVIGRTVIDLPHPIGELGERRSYLFTNVMQCGRGSETPTLFHDRGQQWFTFLSVIQRGYDVVIETSSLPV